MTHRHDDPQLNHALGQIAGLRGILDRLERVLRLPRRSITADLHQPFRALTASLHNCAIAWNALSTVKEPAAEPEVSPNVTRGEPELVTDEGAMAIRRAAERTTHQ